MIISIYIILLSGAGNNSCVFRLDKIYVIAHMDEVQAPERLIVISARYITLQWITQTNCFIRWIVIYPLFEQLGDWT